jgi:hypothetical protein
MSNLSGSIRWFSLRASTVSLIALAALLCALAPLPVHAASQIRIVRLSDVQGSVQIDKNSGMGFENAFLNLPVTQGTQIQTRGNGRVEIEFEDGSTLRLAPNSKVDFSTLGLSDSGARLSAINLVNGTAYVNWLGKPGDRITLNFSREKVELDHAAHLRADASPELTKVAVFKGEIQVAAPAGAVTVGKKKMATFDAADDDKATLAANIDQEPLDAWDKEAIAYHDQYSKNNSSPYGYGLSDMNYYGSFMNVAGYGTMWQPYFTNAGWSPFADGAWSWYPGMGYTFISANPWGWMPYRYGNWAFVPPMGWMWQPGYSNGWATVPRFSGAPVGFHPPVAPTGTVSTIVVGKGGPVLSPVLPSHVVVARGSAGIGVPRGSLGDLKPLNRQVAKSGQIEVRSAPQFSASSASVSRGSQYGTTSASSGRTSAGQTTSAASSHGSSAHR